MLAHVQRHLQRYPVVHVLGVQLALALMLIGGVMGAAAHVLPSKAAPAPVALRTARFIAIPAFAAAPATIEPTAEEDATIIRLQDLTPEAARLWNAANPIAKGPNPAAKPFKLAAKGVLDEARAVDCMTAGIYYEAGFESLDGQRAVAQVVINRMRNPLFPKTVCGVVFQGSERVTGCQFTFTCDGALAREPQAEAWGRARKVAEAALHGYVMKRVGNATHYHAAYVAPYWSPSLVKVAVIGQHIFYRWTGGMGMPPAFGGRYAGGEMKGLQMATLDKLAGSARGKVAAQAKDNGHAAPLESQAVVQVAAIPPAAPVVTAQAMAADAQAIVKAEDLDWQGRARQKGPPRIASPGGF